MGDASKIKEAIIKGKTWIENSYAYDTNLTPIDKLLYFSINSGCFGNHVSVSYSQDTMANLLNVSLRTISRSIKKLAQFGYLSIKRRGSISNITTVVALTLKEATGIISDMKKKYFEKKNYENKYEKKPDTWNDYPQRQYDYNDLEAKLLGWDTPKTSIAGELFEQMHLRE